VIRPARDDEIPALVAAYDWLFAPPGVLPPQWDDALAAERLRRLIAADDGEVFVAAGDGAIVGICTVALGIESVRFGRCAWVEDLAVHADHRSAGHGKGLLDAAKDWGRAHGADYLQLDSGDARVDAHRFYEREQPSSRSRSFRWYL
jgi:GNAT superfamily N-acetyltransferase